MSICRLLQKELEHIQESQIDPQNLDPQKYDLYIQELTAKTQRLEMLSQLAKLSNESLEKIDTYWHSKSINVENLVLEDLFAKQPDDISDTTIVCNEQIEIIDAYADNKTVEKFAYFPKSLRITKRVWIQNTDQIEEIDFDSVLDPLSVSNTLSLKAISVGEIEGSTRICNNSGLTTITVNQCVYSIGIISNPRLISLFIPGKHYSNVEINDNALLPSIALDQIKQSCTINRNDSLESVKVSHVGQNLCIKKNSQLKNIECGNIVNTLDVVENNNLETLSVANIGTNGHPTSVSEIFDNPTLSTMICGNIAHSIKFRNNLKLTLSGITSIHGGKVQIQGLLVLEDQFSQNSDEEILQTFDVDPDNIIRS